MSRLAELRKRINEVDPGSPDLSVHHGRALKRAVGQAEIDQMSAKYRSGIATNQLMAEHHLAKPTISALLKANSVVARPRRRTPFAWAFVEAVEG